MFMDYHVAADLSPVHSIPPYLDGADCLERYDVEDEDIQGIVADKDEETTQDIVVAVDSYSEVMNHQETGDACERECPEVAPMP